MKYLEYAFNRFKVVGRKFVIFTIGFFSFTFILSVIVWLLQSLMSIM